jgi:hypothetical protein
MRKPYGKYGVLGLFVLALLLGLLLTAGPASAVTETQYTAIERPLWGDPLMSSGLEWWTPGDNTYHQRDAANVFWIKASDPRMTGRDVGIKNCDGYFVGGVIMANLWGTNTRWVDYGGGGVWEGDWTAKWDDRTGAVLTAHARGVSGSVAGLAARYTVYEGPYKHITEVGYIIEP